jgi:glutaredoxin
MYTRSGCHLCEEAHSLLEVMRARFNFKLEIVDVDNSAELVQLYGDRVPVLMIGGKDRLWGKINPVLLDRLLRAECNRVCKADN